MRARLVNMSDRRRLAWTELAVPYGSMSSHEATFISDDGVMLRAVRGTDRGKHSTFYRVLAPYAPGQVIDGELVDKPLNSDGSVTKLILSDWVTDDVNALIPNWVVRIGGQDYSMDNPTISTVGRSAAHVRYHVKGRLKDSPGFVGQFWVTFYHLQDVADIEGNITWSDRNTPSVVREVDFIGIESGEYIKFDFDTHKGMAKPIKINGKWVTVVTPNIGFADATSIPVSGRMLCVRQHHSEGFDESMAVDTEEHLPDGDPAEAVYNLRIDCLLAAFEGPAVGSVQEGVWEGKWLAQRWIPRHRRNINPSRNGDTGSIEDANRYHDDLMRRYDTVAPANTGQPAAVMYHQRPHVIFKNPGSTGAQPDFGSTKGSFAVSLGDPRWIWHCMFCLEGEFFRGLMHFEDNGVILTFEDHPDWITWSGGTHFRQKPRDTLGKKSTWGNVKSTGHRGHDDQHRSENMLNAFLALRDSSMYEELLHHWIVSDQAMQKDRVGSARAVGRLNLAWSNRSLVLDGVWYHRNKGVMNEKKASVDKGWRGGSSTTDLKILSSSGPDPRSGVHDGKGNYLPTWSVWMNSLGAVGFYAAWKATGDRWYLDRCEELCHTIIKYGIFEEGGRYHICYSVWYPWGDGNWGKPVTEVGGSYKTTYALGEHHSVSIGLSSWTIPAVLIYNELHPNEESEIAEKARGIRKQYTGDIDANSWDDAEWWACVESITQ